MNEEDFIKNELIEVKIGERVFQIKPLTGKESDEILDKNLSVDETTGSINISLAKRNEIWIKKCVVNAPYELNGTQFKDLKPEERLEIIQKLKPYIRTALIKKLDELNNGTKEEKKSLN